MPRYVALLRAVNIGKRQTPMARVRSSLTNAGFDGVQTHIQTGNVLVTTSVLDSEAVADRVRGALTVEFGFDVPAIVRRPEDLSGLLRLVDELPDPFPEGRSYAAFLASPLADDAAAVFDSWDVPGEWARVVGQHVVIRLGVPFHQASLGGARIERAGVMATVRDLRVVRAMEQRWGA